MAISASQIRAARGMLNWSQPRLAEESEVGITTVRKLETKEIQHRSSFALKVREAFERAGLEFIEPNGVRYSDKLITYYEEADSCDKMFEEIIQTVRDKGGDVVFEIRSSQLFNAMCSNKRDDFARLARLAENALVKCLISDVEHIPVSIPSVQLRVLNKVYLGPISFVVYGNKLAVIAVGANGNIEFKVLNWAGFSDQHKGHFMAHWPNATPALISAQHILKQGGAKRHYTDDSVIASRRSASA